MNTHPPQPTNHTAALAAVYAIVRQAAARAAGSCPAAAATEVRDAGAQPST